MTEWYEQAYLGGKMVAVLGFPRPLYPPDAKDRGHAPSVDGSDVEAYKRTVSRAGRWEWQAFDQCYSNGFAHGKSANVRDSGIAGVQRQQGLEATGFVGEKTFNTLRSIRCPPGPHEGEMAMDARSVELINAAWERFGGKEPEPVSANAARARLEHALTQIGVSEDPPNSNQCKYTQWYGMVGPWCAMFVTWVDQLCERPTDTFLKGNSYAYVPYIVSDGRLGINGLSITSTPNPGDLVCYDWGWDGEYDHIGLVETPPDASGEFMAVEGNTSLANDSNGGEVMRRSRNKYAQGTVFVRVQES